MTLQEKFDEIREEAQEEKINAFLSFVKRGKLSLEDGAEGAGISEEEFRQRLEEQS